MRRILSGILVFAMLLTMVPTVFAASDYTVDLGAATYEVAPGGTVEIPVYVKNNNGTGTDLGMFQVGVVPPAGFKATAVGSTNIKTSDITIHPTTQAVGYVNDSGISFTNEEAIITITLTAPATEGTYDITFSDETFLLDGDFNQIESVDMVGAKINVKAATQPPVEEDDEEITSDKDYMVNLGKTKYTVAPGATIEVPVYVVNNNGTGTDLGMFQVGVVPPAGFTATAVGSTNIKTSDITIHPTTQAVGYVNDSGISFTNEEAIITITLTAPATEGTYDITFSDETFLLDGDFNQIESVDLIAATIVVGNGGSIEPPVVDPEPSLVVNPTAIEVPYGADVVEYIKANAKVYYYADVDAEAADVTADAVITEDGVVTYNGLTANIAVTKVTLVDIVLSTLEKIVVPYGTADVKTYVEAEAAKIEVTAKYSNNTSAVVPATVEYAGNVVTISYDGIAKTVEVEEIKAVAIGVVPNTDIVVPYGSDVAEYIKTAIRVQVETSNGEKVAPLGEVAVVDNGDGTATVTADGCEATVTYTIGANPEDIASIEVTAGELVVPYGADAAAYIAANVTVTATKNSGATEVVGITAENVVAVDGVATITVEGCEATVNYTVETITGIEAAVEALDLAWDADVEAAVKAVAVYYVYSANTENSVVPAEEITYEIKDTEAVITVGEFTATIALNIAAKPDYFVEEVAPAYDLEGHKAIVISMNVEGVPYVNGVAAVKVADAKFVFVTDEEYTIEVKEETAEIVAWGTLHRDDMVTALDALMALNAADGVIADEFNADDNTYIKADIDLNYDITATDALGINNISLGKTTVVTMAE